jgi:hypothetical protein
MWLHLPLFTHSNSRRPSQHLHTHFPPKVITALLDANIHTNTYHGAKISIESPISNKILVPLFLLCLLLNYPRWKRKVQTPKMPSRIRRRYAFYVNEDFILLLRCITRILSQRIDFLLPVEFTVSGTYSYEPIYNASRENPTLPETVICLLFCISPSEIIYIHTIHIHCCR